MASRMLPVAAGRPVLGQRAAGLAHEPDRDVVDVDCPRQARMKGDVVEAAGRQRRSRVGARGARARSRRPVTAAPVRP